ncbi:WUSCHEL-related homeobox 8-like [Phoenix dactylifera]|uniref:WUSCHEL-related homeobox 8-like n=1 Tax=Phoenix dactylifera TaxID=42345 RepID=A0A8B7D3N5_PHODC|nr:WUSCHEL-related homeobox 8-like [Phoenix dactylifera]
MEWEMACAANNSDQSNRGEGEERRGGGEGMTDGVLYMKVMTDEQMEVLRRQISVYATICEQLVEMHKAVTAQQDSLAGMRLGRLYCDPLMTPGGHKITARQRWTPTPMQLQILESIFDQGNGTPSKQKIKDVTLELSQHGQISETNVYNWFQNRRARSKRKQSAALPNNTDSEVEADDESPSEKKPKSEKHTHESLPSRIDDISIHGTQMNPELRSIDLETNPRQGMYASNGISRSYGTLGQMPFYENALSNSRFDHLIGKMEIPRSFSPCQQGESYDLIG